MGSSSSKEKRRKRETEIRERWDASLAEARAPDPGPPDGFAGEYTYKNGDKASGQFRNGKLNGKGRFYWAQHPYQGWREGNFEDNVLNGQGKQRYDCADNVGMIMHSEGRFENGVLIEGKNLYYPHNKFSYNHIPKVSHEGTFDKAGCAEGYGVRVYPNGDRFEGQFVGGDIKLGYSGVYIWKDGSSFRGEFAESGVKRVKNGRACYDREGKLMDGEMSLDKWYPRDELQKEIEAIEKAIEEKNKRSEEWWEKNKHQYAVGSGGDIYNQKGAAIAAGWSAMQQNPGNTWVAGGVGSNLNWG